ncbi:uncharacterized protein TrAtP1_002091 [Trichoderma atroviride]|uniref:uncharacterized protein n=1 Tax=Hypocrea atroviridis TaxID=63577 RepID=UPI00332C6EEA|nr:hypothetical protein TrAtP1_002091 [Trichoderma atroviride]
MRCRVCRRQSPIQPSTLLTLSFYNPSFSSLTLISESSSPSRPGNTGIIHPLSDTDATTIRKYEIGRAGSCLQSPSIPEKGHAEYASRLPDSQTPRLLDSQTPSLSRWRCNVCIPTPGRAESSPSARYQESHSAFIRPLVILPSICPGILHPSLRILRVRLVSCHLISPTPTLQHQQVAAGSRNPSSPASRYRFDSYCN